LTPARPETRSRVPVRSVCTYTAELPPSNETYASRRASGDHDGDRMGCVDSATRCAFSPSASETMSRNSFDVGDLRAEHARDACQLLEDHVRDAVRRLAQIRSARLQPEPGQGFAAQNVEQLERRREVVRRVLGQRADDEVVRIERAPLLEVDLRRLRRPRRHVARREGREAAAAAQVGADDAGEVERGRAAALPPERHDGNRHRALAAFRDRDVELRLCDGGAPGACRRHDPEQRKAAAAARRASFLRLYGSLHYGSHTASNR
jgi:hypothetical protein